jgi:2-keto-3-deoxy-L-arabinonate dehydratase
MGDGITARFEGIFPILATCFSSDESIDYPSQGRLIDFCIEGGVHGLVTLANASEGYLLDDAEKDELVQFCLRQIAGRVPLVVTINHPSSLVAARLARRAEAAGAAAVMALPPFFGRWRASPNEIEEFFREIDRAVGIPIIFQDHALTDIVLPADFFVQLSRKIHNLRYLKLEFGNLIHKTRRILAGDHDLDGVFGGNSGILLPEEYEAGCCGTMPACYMPEIFRKTWDLLEAGDHESAVTFFAPYARLAMYENSTANLCVWKELLRAKGVIANGRIRGPVPAFANNDQFTQLLNVARHLSLVPPEQRRAASRAGR